MTDNGRNDVLYGRVVVGGDITPHKIPPLPSRHQLEYDNVWAMEEEFLKVEVLRLTVEDRNAAVMRYRRLCCCDSIPA